jgi:hypothetical protein
MLTRADFSVEGPTATIEKASKFRKKIDGRINMIFAVISSSEIAVIIPDWLIFFAQAVTTASLAGSSSCNKPVKDSA